MNFRDPWLRTESVRLRSGEPFSSSGTRDATTVFELQPHLQPRGEGQISVLGVNLAWAPEIMIQYDHFEGGPNSYAIFQKRNDALRIGPQVALTLWCDQQVNPLGCAGNWLGNLGFTITGHASGDALGDRGYGFVQAALNYKIGTLAGVSYGTSLSYGYGNSDVTGNLQSQIKLGLTVKYGKQG